MIDSKKIAVTAVMTAFVYVMTCISLPMPPPLGVWHLGDIASFLVAILCGPYIGAFACGVGAMFFDIWNPLWGSQFITWFPATIVIRGFMGFLIGFSRKAFGNNPRLSGILSMIIGAIEKNFGYFLYDFFLFGSVAFLDLITFFPLSALDIVIAVPLLEAIRKMLKVNYIF